MPQLSANAARKRPRLSLKGSKKAAAAKSDSCDVSHELQNSPKDTTTFEDAEVHSPPEECIQEPVIIGFENLGNTCFLNSVLQILRYMPGFLEGLEATNKDITQAEKLQSEINNHMKKEQGDVFEKPDDCLSWQVVRILHQLFSRMESREKKWRQVGKSSGVTPTVTIKPERLLEKIRQINPMFEGYLQHDAQEMLRCLLCYLQDAQKEIIKVRSRKKEIDMKKSSDMSIARYFGKGSISKTKACMSLKSSEPCDYNDRMASFQAGDFLDNIKTENLNCVDKQYTLNTEPEKHNISITDMSTLTSDPNRLSFDEIDSLAVTPTSKKKETDNVDITASNCNKPCNKHTRKRRLENPCDNRKSLTKNSPEPLSFAQIPNGVCSTLEGGSMAIDQGSVKSNANTKSELSCVDGETTVQCPLRSETTSTVSAPLSSHPKKRGRKRKKFPSGTIPEKLNDESSCKKSSAEEMPMDSTQSYAKSQPSVLSLFGRREAGCKRLGMRGAAVAKICNGQEAPNNLHDKIILETAKTSSDLKSSHPNHTGDPPTDSIDLTKLEISPLKTRADAVTQDIRRDTTDTLLPTVKQENIGNVDEGKIEMVMNSQLRSPSKRCSGVMEHVSETNLKSAALHDIKQAQVKLEKCDTVCNSPFKSVSATKAIEHLGAPTEKNKDFVEQLFQGEMVLRTRCMACECSRERREVFQDVSVPLKNFVSCDPDDSDEEQEEASLSCLMSAFSDVERLCGDNKYFCENCYSYEEAERSLHYETLPDVLTLHLKRFAASSGFMGNLTKINDHIMTPDYLPCLRYKCPRPCQRTDHRYKLFGLIAHSGLSITSGHYTSYVRLLADSRPVRNLVEDIIAPVNKTSLNKAVVPSTIDLPLKSEGDQADSPCATGSARGAASLPEDSIPPNSQSADCKVHPDLEEYVNKWLECDDDFVQVLNEEDFERRLAPNSGYNTTPYVLFYIKDNDFI